jgi:hypothetical protein
LPAASRPQSSFISNSNPIAIIVSAGLYGRAPARPVPPSAPSDVDINDQRRRWRSLRSWDQSRRLSPGRLAMIAMMDSRREQSRASALRKTTMRSLARLPRRIVNNGNDFMTTS